MSQPITPRASSPRTRGEARPLVREGDDEAALYRRAAAAEMLGWHDRLVRRLLDVEPRQLTVDLVNRRAVR